MNTLSRAITSTWLNDEHGYQALRAQWRSAVHTRPHRRLTAAHHLVYLALLGKDWRSAFTPITNICTLANGGFFNWTLFRALAAVHSRLTEPDLLAPFGTVVTPEMLASLRAALPRITAESFGPEHYTMDGFPFEAYTVAVSTQVSFVSEPPSHPDAHHA